MINIDTDEKSADVMWGAPEDKQEELKSEDKKEESEDKKEESEDKEKEYKIFKENYLNELKTTIEYCKAHNIPLDIYIKNLKAADDIKSMCNNLKIPFKLFKS